MFYVVAFPDSESNIDPIDDADTFQYPPTSFFLEPFPPTYFSLEILHVTGFFFHHLPFVESFDAATTLILPTAPSVVTLPRLHPQLRPRP